MGIKTPLGEAGCEAPRKQEGIKPCVGGYNQITLGAETLNSMQRKQGIMTTKNI